MSQRPGHPSDATPAYRGYRRQALYALGRLFDDGLGDGATLQPEGIEDLAIYDTSGRLVEVVQVKDHTTELTFSELSPGFFTRVAERVCDGSDAAVTLASFGPVGPELTQAIEGSGPGRRSVAAKLTNHLEACMSDRQSGRAAKGGRDTSLATKALDQMQLQRPDEDELTADLSEKLSASAAGVDVQSALDLLWYWMLVASEQRRRIRRQDAVDRLFEISRFVAGRAAFYEDWHTSIVPLRVPAVPDEARLQREFYQGGPVRFDHIVAGVDVPRQRFLEAIHSGFGEEGDRRVVVVHSASGQGKSTIAYRYLREMVPDVMRLEALSAEGLDHARRMARAINEQTATLGVPTVVYVDVKPGDVHWVELIRELAAQELIRVLVTVREEDWQRVNVSPGDFLWSNVQLDFEEAEAQTIYDALSRQGKAGKDIDFADAWARFGARKTLFEFVYFLTQEQTLADRVAAQVTTLEDRARRGECQPEELDFLRLVAVASAYEAKLDLAALAEHCQLAAPQRTVRLFEEEYLVRLADDRRLVDGYHAIRSTILAERLTDPDLCPWGKVAAVALPMMDEGDLEAFLLTAFSRRPEDRRTLVAGLADLLPRTWAGVTGVCRALLWLGSSEYADRNLELINEAREFSNHGWWLLLDWDVGGAAAPNQCGLMDWDALGELFADAAIRSRELRNRQTDKHEVFSHARRWLDGLIPPTLPSTSAGWLALAEAVYWAGHLGGVGEFREVVTPEAVSAGFDVLPMQHIPDFARAVQTLSPQLYWHWFEQHGAERLARLRREAGIVHLKDDGTSTTAHFIIPLDLHDARLHQAPPDEETAGINSKALSDERYRLVSEVLPDLQTCGAAGYGHRSSLVPADLDESVTQAGPDYVRPAMWSAKLNGVSQNAVDYRFRPSSWDDYLSQLRHLRTYMMECLRDLRLRVLAGGSVAFDEAFPQDGAWQSCGSLLGAGLQFPRVAVDEWGFVTEAGLRDQKARTLTERFKLNRRLRVLDQAVSEFCRTWHNFFSQVLSGYVSVFHLGPVMTEGERKRRTRQLRRLGINVDLLRLSVIHGCDGLVALQHLDAVLSRLPGRLAEADLGFQQREQREALAAIDAWAASAQSLLPDADPEHHSSHPLRDIARAAQRRLERELHALQDVGVGAAILPSEARWESKQTLWLTCDVDTPLLVGQALALLWLTLHQVFEPDRRATIPREAIDLTWQEIVVVPLVRGRAQNRQVHPNFKTTIYRDEPLTEADVWLLYPSTVEPPLWQQLGVSCWPTHPLGEALERMTSHYGEIFARVDHMADFARLPEDLDELGTELLHDHLQAEAAHVSRSLDECQQALVDMRDLSSNRDSADVAEGAAIIDDLWRIVEIQPVEQPQARLTLEDVVAWRDSLLAGWEQLGIARQLIYAGVMASGS